MQDVQTTWQTVLHDLELVVSKAMFTTWFKNTHGVKSEDGIFFVGVPNEFYREWLSTKFHKEILKNLRAHDEHVRNVEYVISKTAPIPSMSPKPQPTMQAKELPLEMSVGRRDNLNPKYTFDNFIIGPFNEVAYSAGQATLRNPGTYNPLFIYGATGLGKTHLIQGIGNSMKIKNPNINILYTNTEKFTNDYVSALQTNKINSFKEKYRSYDVFIMDDIQFLSGRDKTQEELFHLFNTFFDKGRQVIFSSDKHPNYIQGLEDRLKSRLSQGMIIDISKPEYESRIAILNAKCREHGIAIAHEVLDFIAMHVEGNIRELEGIFNTLMAQMDVKKRELNIQEVKLLIKNNIKPKKNVSVEDIIKTIAHFYNLDESLIYEKTRRKEIVRARQVAMYILREDFSISFPLIGRKMGGRDHTTVIHSCDKIKTEVQTDTELAQEIEQIRSMLST
ncbi:MAG: dnaA [Patescibacteria group bacterium]|nr:dnaA [Patescibacteria group bacterium]